MTTPDVASYSHVNISREERSATLFVVDSWSVHEMHLTWEKVTILWQKMQQHKTLFSDLTRDSFENFVSLLVGGYSYWLEVWGDDDLVGIAYFNNLEMTVEAEGHLVFFDREPAAKRGVCRKIIEHMFEKFPINRISVMPPAIYHATIRLAKKIGFSEEGVKREAVLMGGRWHDVILLGITRREVTDVISIGSKQAD